MSELRLTPAAFSECRGCGESFTNMPDDGLCFDCARERRIRARGERRAELLSFRSSREAILETSGAPKKVRRTPFDLDVLGGAWPGNVDRWQGEPWSVYLYGYTGAGKSVLACELLYRMGGGRFVDCAVLAELNFGGEMPAVRDAPVLVVDEVGRGLWRSQRDLLVSLVRHRENEQLPTVLTGQASLEDLAKSRGEKEPGLDGSMLSRLAAGLVIEIEGGSKR